MSAIGKNHTESLQSRLDWLHRHQPHNIEVINSVKRKLDAALRAGLTGNVISERRTKPQKVVLPPIDHVPADLKTDYDDFVSLFREKKTTDLYQIGSSATRFHAYCLFLRDYSKKAAA